MAATKPRKVHHRAIGHLVHRSHLHKKHPTHRRTRGHLVHRARRR